MRNLSILQANVGFIMLALSGCAMDLAAQADAAADEACRRADTLIMETQTQVATLRAEMAATRIEAAKKEAELQELRRHVQALQAERAKLHQIQMEQENAMEGQQESLRALRQERDELAEAKRMLQSALANVSGGASSPSTEVAAAPVDNKVEALEASIVALTTQIQHLREDGELSAAEAQSVFSIRVERGDTLGELATQYGVSIEAIQEANGLTGDLIHAGQRLFIPRVPILSTPPMAPER